jgi:hypothetical protein
MDGSAETDELVLVLLLLLLPGIKQDPRVADAAPIEEESVYAPERSKRERPCAAQI